MEAHLPMEKLDYLWKYLCDWQLRACCTLKEVQELVGFLQFCTQVIPHSRTFVWGLINFSMTFKSDFTLRYIPGYAHADILWWLAHTMAWNGI